MTDIVDFSLATLAGIDVAQVEDLRFETLPQGLYTFEIVEAGTEQGANSDGDTRFVATFIAKIVEVMSVLVGGVDKESLVGKTINERYFITPPSPAVQALDETNPERLEAVKRFNDAVRRLKTAVKDMGGAQEGGLLAAVESTRGLFFNAKIAHRVNRDDPSKPFVHLRLTPAE